ncbi:hypothetical protein Hokovirus_3_176 [Hokovirus HKV1]|uniref:Uncharacterized protein n=1 Tax=Hokovirus HKV1 TaxID=1977638 RepID=A0A1V0SGR2_9VIRU|nr:hypothetical protein Hokovirus_3_176 [Hokovirus HKV1]
MTKVNTIDLINKSITLETNINLTFSDFFNNVGPTCKLVNNIDNILRLTDLLLGYYDLDLSKLNTLKKHGLDLKNYVVKYIMFICGIIEKAKTGSIALCMCPKYHSSRLRNKYNLELINPSVLVNLIATYPKIKQLFDIFYNLFDKKINYGFKNNCFENAKNDKDPLSHSKINICFETENSYIYANVLDGLIDYYFLNNKLPKKLIEYVEYQYLPSLNIMESEQVSNQNKNIILKGAIRRIEKNMFTKMINFGINLEFVLNRQLREIIFYNNLDIKKYLDKNMTKLIYVLCENENYISEKTYSILYQYDMFLPLLISKGHTENYINFFD